MKSLSSYIKEAAEPVYKVCRECYFESTASSDVDKLCDAIDVLNDKYDGVAAGEVFLEYDDEPSTLFSTYGMTIDDLEMYEEALLEELGNLADLADMSADPYGD